MDIGRTSDPARSAQCPATHNYMREIRGGLDRLPVGRLPTGLPSSTVYDRLGILERMHHALYVAAREQTGREASPSAAIIDAQSA